MNINSHLQCLVNLATDLGYRIDRRPNNDGVRIRISAMGQSQLLRLDPSMSRTDQFLHVAYRLANDPQLAMYVLSDEQETSLQFGREMVASEMSGVELSPEQHLPNPASIDVGDGPTTGSQKAA